MKRAGTSMLSLASYRVSLAKPIKPYKVRESAVLDSIGVLHSDSHRFKQPLAEVLHCSSP